jgi:hypothetical protein
MGRDVERSGFAKGKVIAKYLSPDRRDLACGTIGKDRRANDQGPGGHGDVRGAVADLDAIGTWKPRLAGPDQLILKPN